MNTVPDSMRPVWASRRFVILMALLLLEVVLLAVAVQAWYEASLVEERDVYGEWP